MAGLEEILSTWTAIDSLLIGATLITAETRKAIENLRKHILNGCLSDIPTYATGMNENLHKNLNKLMKGQKMGPQLAFAILTVFFFLWNRKRSMKVFGEKKESILEQSFVVDNVQKELNFGIGCIQEQKLGLSQQISGKWTTSRSNAELISSGSNTQFARKVMHLTYLFRFMKSRTSKDLDVRLFCHGNLNQILDRIFQVPKLSGQQYLDFGFVTQPVVPIFMTDKYNLISTIATCVSNHFQNESRFKQVIDFFKERD